MRMAQLLKQLFWTTAAFAKFQIATSAFFRPVQTSYTKRSARRPVNVKYLHDTSLSVYTGFESSNLNGELWNRPECLM